MIELTSNQNNNQHSSPQQEQIYHEVEVSVKSRSKSRSAKRVNSLSEVSIKQSSSQVLSSDKNVTYTHPCILKMRAFLDSVPVQVIMTILTLYILFADDIKNLATTKRADNTFSTICVTLMGIFFIELIISAIAAEDYFLGFYFWLDFISLVSMLLDVHWFYDWMVNSVAAGGKQAKSIGAIAKAGKSAKIAARAIRILRILRIIRLVRISKLYKAKERIIKLDMKKKEAEKKNEKNKKQGTKQEEKKVEQQEVQGQGDKKEEEMKKEEEIKNDKQNEENNNNNVNNNNKDNKEEKVNPIKEEHVIEIDQNENKEHKNDDANSENQGSEIGSSSMSKTEEGKVPEESKVGKLLSDRTTKKVIILVLAMMIGIILFSPSFYLEKKTGMEYGLKIFSNFKTINDPNLNLSFSIYVTENIGTNSPVIYARVGYLVYGDYNDTLNLRDNEKNSYSEDCSFLMPEDEANSICEAVFDIRSSNKLSSTLNIIKTIFICFVLSFGSYCFSKDTSEMVLEPIEQMIEKVKQISQNPIEALQRNEKEEITKALLEEEENNATCSCSKGKDKNSKNKTQPLETEMLENTIAKIGSLLALSFGDAGSEIIAKNMQKNSNGEVNPMIVGKKVCAIYGFCDIRNFTDTTEILQEKVMVFVNSIAEIVHEISSEYGGSANKNIGDAFLLVWKFKETFTYVNKNTNELCVYNCEQVNQLCDMALISIIKILAKIYKSYVLDKYRKNEKLNKKFKNYSVKLGFGAHLGWSIEGAIGSSFKIDASYLSPNANMANSCEERTKDYGVLMVLSDKFVEKLSDEAQKCVRMLDIINTNEQLGLYTVDLDLNNLTIEDKATASDEMSRLEGAAAKKMAKFQKRMLKKKNIADATANPPRKRFWKEFIEDCEDFELMRQDFTKEFYDNYNEGFDEYHFGDWSKAKKFLEKAVSIRPDMPSQRMLDKMKEYNYTRPKNWKGSE